MTRWTLALLAGLGCMVGAHLAPEPAHVLVLTGNLDGYISPCGCTKPMTGGIRRQASAVRTLTSGQASTVLVNGGLSGGVTRQEQWKTEAMLEALSLMKPSALHLTFSEARFGLGMVETVKNLVGDAAVQSNLAEAPGIRDLVVSGPFVIGAVSPQASRVGNVLSASVRGMQEAVQGLLDEAEAQGRTAILMLDDGQEEAKRLAREFPKLGLIQYRSTGDPLPEPTRVGKTWIVSPGEHGKAILRLTFENGELGAYRIVSLGPEYADDPATSRVYRDYLARVNGSDLLEKVARTPAPVFAGSAACIKCHPAEGKVWKASAHAHALRTLIDDGHGRDPECVGCHVVGLKKTTGFKSVEKTPQLANVGCESCHGPGAAHAAKPTGTKMGRVGAASCAPCHIPANSPGFDFGSYWKRIRH